MRWRTEVCNGTKWGEVVNMNNIVKWSWFIGTCICSFECHPPIGWYLSIKRVRNKDYKSKSYMSSDNRTRDWRRWDTQVRLLLECRTMQLLMTKVVSLLRKQNHLYFCASVNLSKSTRSHIHFWIATEHVNIGAADVSLLRSYMLWKNIPL
jgi:hypothetical protein